jgi:tetratricopeptide (TPR) repeat protein
VVVTSSRRSAVGLGTPVAVDVFSDSEALAFLNERTGLDEGTGARELAAELGWLPLGLAQAAALIAREHLDYRTYLQRLRALPVTSYLGRVEGDAYPYRLAEAVVLSLRAAEESDRSGICGRLMRLVSVLAETGVPRRMLHLAASVGMLGYGQVGAVEVDAAVGKLADASLLSFTVDDSVITHRLVMRVARERLAGEGRLAQAVAEAMRALWGVAGGFAVAWHDPAGVRELARQVNAVVDHTASHQDAVGVEMFMALTPLRLRSVYLLNELGESTGLAIAAAELLVADCERLLGADNPNTLSARINLGYVYRAAGRAAEAIPMYERTLADCERVLGADGSDTLSARNNLGTAYWDAGRTAEAIPLLERTLAGRERMFGADNPNTLIARGNLAMAYTAAGRAAEATPLLERTLADFELGVGTDHPSTLVARGNLAMAYTAAGRAAEAISLSERTLADFERVLGTDHPHTLTSRRNLGVAYEVAGRAAEAISMYERTLADRERILGVDHPDTKVVRKNLAALTGKPMRSSGN